MAILLCVVLACAGASAQYRTDKALAGLDRSEVAAEMEEQVGFLSAVALEGRKAGSEGEKLAAEYVAQTLSSYGVDVLSGAEGDLFGIRRESGDTLTSRNVTGYIQGYDRTLRDSYIVIGARLDGMGSIQYSVDGEAHTKIYPGANGNASGLAMMMQLARKLSTNRVLLRRSVIFVAFGSSLEGNVGSWYFLNRSFGGVKNIDAMVNLDMVGTGSSGFYAYAASNTDMEKILKEMQGSLQPVLPTIVAREPVGSDHRMFYNSGIPAVFFTTGMYPEYNTDRDTADILEYDWMERGLEYLYNFCVSLANGSKPEFNPSEETRKKHSLDRDVTPYYECDVKPTFLGSSDPGVFLKKWVYTYLRYPSECVHNGIQGRVLVDFIINEKGKVTDVKVLKGVDELLDEEAVRVIKASPDWKPGKVRGEKVKSEMSLYVEFRLEKKK